MPLGAVSPAMISVAVRADIKHRLSRNLHCTGYESLSPERLLHADQAVTNRQRMRPVADAPIQTPGRIAASWRRIRTSLFWIVLIALILRLAWILIGHTYKFKTSDNHFSFGWEMGQIAGSIASGHGFSNPFGPQTGPTAWEP